MMFLTQNKNQANISKWENQKIQQNKIKEVKKKRKDFFINGKLKFFKIKRIKTMHYSHMMLSHNNEIVVSISISRSHIQCSSL